MLLPNDEIGPVVDSGNTGGDPPKLRSALFEHNDDDGSGRRNVRGRTATTHNEDPSLPIPHIEPSTITDNTKGKKRKVDDEVSEEGSKATMDKNKKPATIVTKGLLGSRIDYDRQCGVKNDMNLPCARSLTCQTHSLAAKGAVRCHRYDELLLEWNREHNTNWVEPVTRKNIFAEKRSEEARDIDLFGSKYPSGSTSSPPRSPTHSASASTSPISPPFHTYPISGVSFSPPGATATAGGSSSDAIHCICGFTHDDGFSIACDDCGQWCHAVCFDITAECIPDEWKCWECVPVSIDREMAAKNQTEMVGMNREITATKLDSGLGRLGIVAVSANVGRGWTRERNTDATVSIPVSATAGPSRHNLELQPRGESYELARLLLSTKSGATPFAQSISAESADNWDEWWRENTMEIGALLTNYTNFDAYTKMECVMLARSVKIYQRLVVYVCVQMKAFPDLHGSFNSLRETLSEWEEWDDLQWLARHHIVRGTLWGKLRVQRSDRTTLLKMACDMRCILDFDMKAIQQRVMTVLNDREVKKSFLALCQSDPIPVANLFQTLLDQDNLPTESRSQLARTLARLAKLTRCYPDCLIIATIRRIGTDPVAGGGFADVWKGYFSDKPVALKALRIYKQSVRESVLKEFSHEAVIWRQLKHPNILPFYGVFAGDKHFDRLCLVSPWMDDGNVIDYLNIHPDSDRLALLSDIARGLEYLHLFQPPIIHGDLKGANIFVSPSGTACLGDFGLARFRDSQESTLGATTGNTTGTLRWQAPELLNIVEGASTRRSEKCDIYSFGCVCLELMTGKPPFSEIRIDGAVMMAIAKGQIPQRPLENVFELGLDDTLWALMQQCWNFDPALRPRISHVAEYFQRYRCAERLDADSIDDTYWAIRGSLGQYGFPDPFVSELSGLRTQVIGPGGYRFLHNEATLNF